MKTKITRIATVEFTTVVNGSNIPDLITKVKKHPYQYKWEQEVIGDECWSGEWMAPERKFNIYCTCQLPVE